MTVDRLFPSRRTRLALRLTTWSAAATAVAVISTVPVSAEPSDRDDTAEATREVDRLFAEADRAVDAYNGSAERVAELEAEVERRRAQVDRGERAVDEKLGAVGSAAAAHYRAGGISPTLALLLSESPDAYLARSATYERMSDRRDAELRELLAAQRELTQRRDEADARLDELVEERAELSRRKEAAERRLDEARDRLDELTEREREQEARAGRDAPRARTVAEPAPAPVAVERPPAVATSDRGGIALSAALSVLGAPYGWGSTGPDAFDCSGLVQWAYAKAGVSLPRTSQAQAGAGRRVPLDQAQPGDIVVYRSDASHVGLYAGGGQVVHAPYSGAFVRYEAVGMMPVSSVVRP
ncbi:C40 family peptidase [Streptomyces sedi]|uniref:C40 family peptidase n=1 Tax=Streptomyces sedi TaxID=555059 RepID=UPI001B87294C|nr:C40 family peptidase [Streptomyces sedi]